jgi:pimeloyl-ACP methyl ester carboxylesterase
VVDSARTGVVLVHGLWHGGWAWDGVRARLDDAGIVSAAVELPLTSLAEDIAATRAVLDGFDRPAVLVGHSYGGAVVTGAGDHPHVVHLLYLAAFQLADGESVGRTLPERDFAPTRLAAAFQVSEDGRLISLDPAKAAGVMYPDAPADVAAAAVARLRPVHRAVFRGVPDVIGWRTTPSTYVVCADDTAVNPDLERAMAQRATFRLEWPGGHSPATTRPDAVAELITSLVGTG